MAEQQPARQPITAEGLAESVHPQYNEHNLPPSQNPQGRPNYDDPRTSQKDDQDYRWSALIFGIKFWLLIAATVLAISILLGLLALLVWLVYIFTIHYTAPDRAWLDSVQLGRLGAVYGNFAKFAAPTALITNAWLVAYFGTRRLAASQPDSRAERRGLALISPSSPFRR